MREKELYEALKDLLLALSDCDLEGGRYAGIAQHHASCRKAVRECTCGGDDLERAIQQAGRVLSRGG